MIMDVRVPARFAKRGPQHRTGHACDAVRFSPREKSMKIATTTTTFAGALLLALALASPANAAVDAKQAEALMKANKCSSCHHATKTKSGSSLKDIAAEFKGKADAEQLIIDAITKGPMVEIDGEKEEHKVIKTKDAAELKNLAQWILSH
jgi:cytochrome c